MSPLERRAWLQIWAMGLPYAVYFGVQLVHPEWFSQMNLLQRLSCFAAASLTHAAITVVGLVALKLTERGEHVLADERDRAIEGHANVSAYLTLMAGVVLSGVIMPFNHGGWDIVNAALLAIVFAEMVRRTLTALAYRKAPRLAH